MIRNILFIASILSNISTTKASWKDFSPWKKPTITPLDMAQNKPEIAKLLQQYGAKTGKQIEQERLTNQRFQRSLMATFARVNGIITRYKIRFFK